MLRIRSLIAGAALGGLWLAGSVAGFGVLWQYSATPGEHRPPPPRWPADSSIARTAGRPTLVMFVHPRCACSEASANELSWLASRFRGRFTATVLFVRPAGVEEDGWEKTRLWATVSALDGVAPLRDDAGLEAARFGSLTSGQVVVYDEGGHLVFSGGITGSRGHVGDNVGRQAVAAHLGGAREAPRPGTPVYGCALGAGAAR